MAGDGSAPVVEAARSSLKICIVLSAASTVRGGDATLLPAERCESELSQDGFYARFCIAEQHCGIFFKEKRVLYAGVTGIH